MTSADIFSAASFLYVYVHPRIGMTSGDGIAKCALISNSSNTADESEKLDVICDF